MAISGLQCPSVCASVCRMTDTDAQRPTQIGPRGPEIGSDSPLIGCEEVCTLLHISEPTFWRLIKRGDLTSIKLGKRRMVLRESVHALIKERAS